MACAKADLCLSVYGLGLRLLVFIFVFAHFTLCVFECLVVDVLGVTTFGLRGTLVVVAVVGGGRVARVKHVVRCLFLGDGIGGATF